MSAPRKTALALAALTLCLAGASAALAQSDLQPVSIKVEVNNAYRAIHILDKRRFDCDALVEESKGIVDGQFVQIGSGIYLSGVDGLHHYGECHDRKYIKQESGGYRI